MAKGKKEFPVVLLFFLSLCHFKGLRTVTAQIISISLQTWVSPIYQAPYAVMKIIFFQNHLALHTEAIDYGHAYEGDAVGRYSRLMFCLGVSQTVSPSGFVICVAKPWLGATLDGIVGSSIIEVKCPIVCRECSFEEVADTKHTFCLQKTQKGLRLSSKHQYYHHIQMQLFVTKADFSDFVVWSSSQLHI